MKKNNHLLVCDSCGTPALDRIHRGALVKSILGWLPLKKYKCFNCLTNYYILNDSFKIRSF